MLIECKKVQQIRGEPRRRWFFDDFFDLIVWFSKENFILGFQLCYDMAGNQRALTWKRPDAYFHQRIDDGERRPGKHKATPIKILVKMCTGHHQFLSQLTTLISIPCRVL
jgi:hypothetical protein